MFGYASENQCKQNKRTIKVECHLFRDHHAMHLSFAIRKTIFILCLYYFNTKTSCLIFGVINWLACTILDTCNSCANDCVTVWKWWDSTSIFEFMHCNGKLNVMRGQTLGREKFLHQNTLALTYQDIRSVGQKKRNIHTKQY